MKKYLLVFLSYLLSISSYSIEKPTSSIEIGNEVKNISSTRKKIFSAYPNHFSLGVSSKSKLIDISSNKNDYDFSKFKQISDEDSKNINNSIKEDRFELGLNFSYERSSPRSLYFYMGLDTFLKTYKTHYIKGAAVRFGRNSYDLNTRIGFQFHTSESSTISPFLSLGLLYERFDMEVREHYTYSGHYLFRRYLNYEVGTGFLFRHDINNIFSYSITPLITKEIWSKSVYENSYILHYRFGSNSYYKSSPQLKLDATLYVSPFTSKNQTLSLTSFLTSEKERENKNDQNERVSTQEYGLKFAYVYSY